MSSNRISTKENTLHVPRRVPGTTTSESESKTKINLIKIGKYITSPGIINIIITFGSLNYFIFCMTLKLSLMKYY